MFNKFTCPLDDFDENKYLELNIDVKNAVAKGEFISGWSHFISYGYYENRDGGPIKIEQPIKNLLDNIKHPPPHLRVRVHSKVVFTYKSIGKMWHLISYPR